MKRYTHIVLINTGGRALTPLRKRALENARFLKKTYEELPGSQEYFRKLIRGPYLHRDFFFLKPN
ncbi:MAG: DUF1638 domain-containing protein [Desulfobacteraceae bacterium]|nr:MAG: DUF1638 domain-containing protein [Desulfobacteraceae bacterium]